MSAVIHCPTGYACSGCRYCETAREAAAAASRAARVPEPYIDDPDFRLYVGDVRDTLATIPDGSIDCCVTSPPYYGLRDYGTGTWEGGDPDCDHAVRADAKVESSTLSGGKATTGHQREGFKDVCPRCGGRRIDQQIGLEPSPDAYVAEMVAVFGEVRRVLADHGTCWLNLGDSYASDSTYNTTQTLHDEHGWKQEGDHRPNVRANEIGMKAKDLVGVPWRVALALQADGWYLRSDIIWSKLNPMPESVTDRPTKAHEYVFMLTKQPRYYFDQEAVREVWSDERNGASGASRSKFADASAQRNDEGVTQAPQTTGRNVRTVWKFAEQQDDPAGWLAAVFADVMRTGDVSIAETVWSIATKPYADAHFAVFPLELPARCIKAGCPEQVCTVCGKPRERIIEKGEPVLQVDTWSASGAASYDDAAGEYVDAGTASTLKHVVPRVTVGWTECGCAYGLPPDSTETIETPIGTVGEPDPTLTVGRKGLARPRSEDEGVRLITRHEQRGYAAQLREWSDAARHELLTEFGIAETAWEHYVRTDRSGSRPLPADILDACLERGWLDPVTLPEHVGGTYRAGRVLDPFMGSGTTALAARNLHRHAVGVELNPKYAALCARRLQQMSLFA